MTESGVQDRVRLAAVRASLGILWRNNVGVAFDSGRRPIRFGLCNDSKSINAAIKSSDLIGIAPILITPEHVGRTLGLFIAVECKASNWKGPPRSDRELAQHRFHKIVQQHGGAAGFATDPTHLEAILRSFR